MSNLFVGTEEVSACYLDGVDIMNAFLDGEESCKMTTLQPLDEPLTIMMTPMTHPDTKTLFLDATVVDSQDRVIDVSIDGGNTWHTPVVEASSSSRIVWAIDVSSITQTSPTATNDYTIIIKEVEGRPEASVILDFCFINRDSDKPSAIKKIDSKIKVIGGKNLTTTNNMFSGLESVPRIDIQQLWTENITSSHGMFRNCASISSLDVSNMNTSNVTDMSYMFNLSYVNQLSYIDISMFDTSKVVDFSRMFYNASANVNLPDKMIHSTAVDCQHMFATCTNKIFDLSTSDTSNVTNMESMFFSNELTEQLIISDFDVSSVTNMRYCFAYMGDLGPGTDIDTFDTSKTSSVTNFESTFNNTNINNLSVNFVFDSATSTRMMYYEAQKKNNPLLIQSSDDIYMPLNLNASSMFYDANINFENNEITMDMPVVTNISSMFEKVELQTDTNGATINLAINTDIKTLSKFLKDSKVGDKMGSWHFRPDRLTLNFLNEIYPTDLSSMCENASLALVIDGQFNTSMVTTTNSMFLNARSREIPMIFDIPGWDVLEDASYMFSGMLILLDTDKFTGNYSDVNWTIRDLSFDKLTNVTNMFSLDKVIVWYKDGELLGDNFKHKECELIFENVSMPIIVNLSNMFEDINVISVTCGIDAPNVTNMRQMFRNAMVDVVDIRPMSCSGVTDMSEMFSSSKYMVNFIKMFDDIGTKPITNMERMFHGMFPILTKINTENATSTQDMWQSTFIEHVHFSPSDSYRIALMDKSAPNFESHVKPEEMFTHLRIEMNDVIKKEEANDNIELLVRGGFTGMFNISLDDGVTWENNIIKTSIPGAQHPKVIIVSAYKNTKVGENSTDAPITMTETRNNTDERFFNWFIAAKGTVKITGSMKSIIETLDHIEIEPESTLDLTECNLPLSRTLNPDLATGVHRIHGQIKFGDQTERFGLASGATNTERFGHELLRWFMPDSRHYGPGLNGDGYGVSCIDKIYNTETVGNYLRGDFAYPDRIDNQGILGNTSLSSEDIEDILDAQENKSIYEKITNCESDFSNRFHMIIESDSAITADNFKYIDAQDLVITQPSSGIYDIKAAPGSMRRIRNAQLLDNLNDDDKYDIQKVTIMKGSDLSTTEDMFFLLKSLTEVTIDDNADIPVLYHMGRMFHSCESLERIIGINNINTSEVTSMRDTFIHCELLTSLDISNWNTSSVTDMRGIFYNCKLLTSLDLNNWNTSKVTNMRSMFNGCESLKSLDISNWNTSSVTDMGLMFGYCSLIENIQLPSDITSTKPNANFDYMFNSCRLLKCINKIDTTNATRRSSIFANCDVLTQPDAAAQADIIDADGAEWTNPGSCP